MDIKRKMNDRFSSLQGGLFLEVTKADVGEGAGNFMAAGGDIMCWADPFFPDPSLPPSVKAALHAA
ncbi:pyridoxal phosphate-dependent aminotransferase, partial [Oscillospiraceae bacterium OttesenSCG-928-F05]|nr:pyridoxal phosphate-dependent aminotransferase [Oscillospiraceae bacterium OttesenSCG-928-F05]